MNEYVDYVEGVLGYNHRTGRYGLLVMDLWERGFEGFHCGDHLDVWDSDTHTWIPTRFESRGSGLGGWYLVDTPYQGNGIGGLRARVAR